MAARSLVDELLEFGEPEARAAFLAGHAREFSDEALRQLKAVADQLLRADLDRYLEIGEMFASIAAVAQNDSARALSLLIEANAYSVGGLGEYANAVDRYDQAAAIYAALGCELEEARAQVGKVFALTHLGRHEEAEQTAEWAAPVLERHGEWLPLAKMVSNLGISYSRKGDDLQSLAMFERARAYCLRMETQPSAFLPNVEHNRSIALRDLGRYDESMAASERARKLHTAMNNQVEAARALQSLATTYFLLGKYNEALASLDLVRREFAQDGRIRDAMRSDLIMVECLVQLRRFGEALEKCRLIREHFDARGAQYEAARAVLYSAVAYSGLGRYGEAWDALADACALFERQGNLVGQAAARMRQSQLLYVRGRYAESADLAARVAEEFAALERPVDAALANVDQARALVPLGQFEAARTLLERACELGKAKKLPDLCQRCHHLLGVVAEQGDEADTALAEFDQAIEALELLRGRLMVEYRAGFVEDRQQVYADAMELCVRQGQIERSLLYVERAKSRALIDLLGQQIDVRQRARSAADAPLLEELHDLRNERERLMRRWEGSDETRAALLSAGEAGFLDVQAVVGTLEGRITELWHTLLIRNADYAQDAALWRTRVEPFQELLPEDTMLLEYYAAGPRLYLYTVTRNAVRLHALAASSDEIERLLELYYLNVATMAAAASAASEGSRSQEEELATRAQLILRRLYERLLLPAAEELRERVRLIVVPHGALHYLPFQALYDGERYLLERHEISYLPSGSFLRYGAQARSPGGRLLALGHSHGGALPNAVAEARRVAELMEGVAFVEEEATKERLAGALPETGVLHIAAHGEFRGDSPLFSGVLLDDGWLTTLDVFDLDVRASLVTLSGCQTGRHAIGGGDELLGVMRAFLSVGVDSLALTQWRVEDASTARVMDRFYTALARGEPKSVALRGAQLALLEEGRACGGEDAGRLYAHPYYWAPFFLVGNTEPIVWAAAAG